jgi:hypothetical protein
VAHKIGGNLSHFHFGKEGWGKSVDTSLSLHWAFTGVFRVFRLGVIIPIYLALGVFQLRPHFFWLFLLYASFRWRIPQFEHLATTCNIPYRTLPPFFISYPCWLTKAGRKGSLVFPGLLGYMDGWMDVREGGSGIVRHNLSDQLFTFLPFASSLLFFSLLLASSVCLVRNTSFFALSPCLTLSHVLCRLGKQTCISL